MEKTRFNIGDPVIFRADSSFDTNFNFDIEPLYIIFNLVINDSKISSKDKKKLLNSGYNYIICNIQEDCGSGHLGGISYAKDNQLKLYKGCDPDVLSFYNDAMKELQRFYNQNICKKH